MKILCLTFLNNIVEGKAYEEVGDNRGGGYGEDGL